MRDEAYEAAEVPDREKGLQDRRRQEIRHTGARGGSSRTFSNLFLQLHPNPWGDGRHLVDYGREAFRMGPEHWMALQAIHGAVHGIGMNIKYTWFGPGYISNVYFKRLANKPTYLVGTGMVGSHDLMKS